MPKFAFDYVEGGAGEEVSLRRNRKALDAVTLTPRYMRDVSGRSPGVTLFGRTYDLPIGIAPVGLANLAWPGLDLMLARAAREANVPYVLSTLGTSGLERVAAEAPDHLWFQLYASKREEVTFDLLRRAAAVGVRVVVVTVDVPTVGQRDRDIRNGFQLPLRLTLPAIADILRHPSWLLATAAAGAPAFETLAAYSPPGARAPSIAEYAANHVTDKVDLTALTRIRDAWSGRLVIKGIMDVESAGVAVDIGADGIVVSNHGGRQFDASPASIEVLPAISASVGKRLSVMMDSGVRSGVDVLRAFSSGADFVFSARSFVYGAAAAGQPGASRVFSIFREDIMRGLAQLGSTSVSDLRLPIAELA